MIAASPHTVDRMIRIEWPTIEPDIRAKTARLDEPLSAVMTSLAERLEWTEPEFVDIATMRLDVIADCRGHDDAALQTIRTKRVCEQLVVPDPRPACRRVPVVIFLRLAVKAHSAQPFVGCLIGNPPATSVAFGALPSRLNTRSA